MKTRISMLLLVMAIVTNATFATTFKDDVNQKVLATFQQKFSSIKQVSWDKTADLVKATFKLNDQYVFAYFAQTGELLGMSRNILINQLPINLQTELRNKLKNSWITQIFEYSNDDETVYYATLENDSRKIMYQSTSSNSWSAYKRIK